MASEELEVLKIVIDRLTQANIRYLLSGSLAGNFYSQPRMTRDIDIVIQISNSNVDKVYDLFKEDFYIDKSSIISAIKDKGMFNIIHNQKIVKIDFIVFQDTDYENTKFERKLTKNIEGISISIISPEDLILSKLLWAHNSRSEMQLRDVKNIILFNKGELDWDYLRNWSIKLSIKNLLDECLNG